MECANYHLREIILFYLPLPLSDSHWSSLLQVALECDAYHVRAIKPCDGKLHVYKVSYPMLWYVKATWSTVVEIPLCPIE